MPEPTLGPAPQDSGGATGAAGSGLAAASPPVGADVFLLNRLVGAGKVELAPSWPEQAGPGESATVCCKALKASSKERFAGVARGEVEVAGADRCEHCELCAELWGAVPLASGPIVAATTARPTLGELAAFAADMPAPSKMLPGASSSAHSSVWSGPSEATDVEHDARAAARARNVSMGIDVSVALLRFKCRPAKARMPDTNC